MRGPRRVAGATARLVGAPSAMRTGVVQSVGTDGVVVRVAGGNVLCGVLGSDQGVAPGATVAVFQQDSSWMVQGVINGPGSGQTSSLLLPGGQLLNSGGTLAGGITTGSGESNSNVFVTTGDAVVPQGHLIQVRMMVNWSMSAANGQVGARIREGSGILGTQVGSGHGFGPTSGFTYELWAEGWFIGDGQPGAWTLTVQNFTGGTLTVSSSPIAPGVCGAFDWGDASGVQQF